MHSTHDCLFCASHKASLSVSRAGEWIPCAEDEGDRRQLSDPWGVTFTYFIELGELVDWLMFDIVGSGIAIHLPHLSVAPVC